MKASAGVWIDHRKAVIVFAPTGTKATKVIKSGVRNGERWIGGEQSRAADDRRQNAATGEMNGYFDKVLAASGDAKSVFIFGPGEAKTELKKRIANRRPSVEIVAVRTADKMTDRQVAAKVHKYFSLPIYATNLQR